MSIRTNYKATIYASYIGYITQAIINNLSTLLFLIFQKQFGLPLEQITLLITVNFLFQLCVDLVAAKVVDKIGYRPCIIAAHLSAALGLIGMAVFPQVLPSPFAGLLLAVLCYAFGGGLIEVLISPIVEACPTDNKSSVMSFLHSFYCWGTVAVVLLSTLFLWGFGEEHWRILPFLWAMVPLANAIFFTRVPIASLTEEGEGMTGRQLARSGMFWLFILLMIASGASEQAMSQWASAFAESGLGVSKAVGDLTGACMFSVLMGCSRVFYAKMSDQVDLLHVILASAVLCIASYLTASLSPSPVVSLAACGLCGLSVGVLWPGVFSLASVAFPKGVTALFALLAFAGDVGCSTGPTTVGFVSSALGENLKAGLSAGVVFPLLLLVCALLYGKKRHSSEENEKILKK